MTVLDRAYSLLEIRSVDEEQRIIQGWATTPSVDRMGDVVEPLGITAAASIPLLLHHDSRLPVGTVSLGKPTKKGVPFVAKLPKILELGALQDRVNEAWQLVKYGLIAATSIGFRVLDDAYERIETGYRFLKTEVMELSLVAIPAQQEAVITSFKSYCAGEAGEEVFEVIKSIDAVQRATRSVQIDVSGRKAIPGERDQVAPTPPGSPEDPLHSNIKTREGKKMNKPFNVTDALASYEEDLKAKQAQRDEIQATVTGEGRTKNASEREEYDTLTEDIASIEAEINDLRKHQKDLGAAAAPAPEAKTVDQGSALRAAYGSVQLRPKVEKGIAFTRLLGAKYLAHVNHCAPWDIAKSMFNDTPEVEYILRAAVTPGSTTDSTFASPLVVLNNATNEFIELLRAKEIIGRIAGLDRIPFNTQVPRGTQDPTAYWVGQGDVKPLSRPGFDSISLTFAKIAGITAMTEELMKFSSPSAEMKVRDGLIAAVAYLSDRDFLDPTKAASTGISPASITNGVTPTVATGTTADALRDDLGTMFSIFADANEDPSGISLVMTPSQALKIGLMRNSLGQKEFPDISMAGGFLEGFPVITSTNIAATGGSPVDGYPIVAVNAPNVYLAEEGLTVDMSREASLQMDTAPDSPETASTVMVSLWQRNMIALKVERYMTWLKKHSTSVQFISSAKYQ